MKRISLIFLLVLFAVSITEAQKRYDNIKYPELNEFNKPEVETFTADNGITFFLLEDGELPLIDVSVMVRTGGVLIPNEKAGLASITGQVMRSGGSENYPADDLNTLLENNAANISTYVGFSSGGASLNVLKEDFDELLPALVDILKNPAFPEDKIELAKTQAKSGISRRNDSPDQIASREFDNLIYGDNSKYSRTTEYETINNISRDDLTAFHEEHFTGANMMVGVVGDFNAGDMKKRLKEAFSSIPAGDNTNLQFPEVDYDYESTINLADKSDVNQSTVLMGHIGDTRDNPDYAKVQVMNNVLSGGFSGRLFQKVRTDMGLAYSVGGSFGMGNTFYPGKFTIQVQTKTETTAEAIDAIIAEVKRLQNEPITEQELQDTKDQFLNSLVFRNTSYDQILNRQMSNAYRDLPEDSFEEFVEGVKNTSIKDVQDMAQKYLRPEQMQILVVGDKNGLGDQLQKYGKVNELDISIPQPGDNTQKTVTGDAARGRELLDSMADAIIEPGMELNSLSISGEIFIPQMNQKLPVSMTMNYPDAIEQNIQAPQGTITMSYKDGQASMAMAGREQPLPASSPQASNLKSALNRSIIAIARKADELEASFTGQEEVEGTTYNKLNLTVSDKNITLFLATDTNLPAIMQYQEFNPQQGSQVTVREKYADWTSAFGLTYPYSQQTYIGDNEAARATFNSHEVNQ